MFAYKGSTALITGASGGLGEAFAGQLAERGSNLVLVARSEDKLQALARRLEEQNKITAAVLRADLASPKAVEQIVAELKTRRIDVDLLVNIVVGASFLVALNGQSRGLFGGTPEGVGVPIARFAGIALIGLGIACLPAKATGPQQGAVRGLFVFNLGATIFFAWVAMATAFRGFVLWPVVILHAVLTIILVLQIRNRDSVTVA